jgi:ribosomal protein S18 acetylase RimI-like enzyme
MNMSGTAARDTAFNPAILIRAGAATDAADAKGLIYESSQELMAFMFGSRANAEQVLAKLYQLDHGHFSHRFATVVVRESQVVGLQLGYDSEQLARQELLGWAFRFVHSPAPRWWHLLTTVAPTLNKYIPKPTDGMYYINNIVVAKSCRGEGLGKYLIEHTIETARTAGYEGVELDVTTVNESAIRFYKKAGFFTRSLSGDARLHERHGLPQLVRMTFAF